MKIFFTWWNRQTFGTFLKTLFFGKYVGKDVIEDLITTNTDSSYKPSDLNPIYDRNRSLPRDMDRYGYVVIEPLTTKGLTNKEIGSVGDKMRGADGYVYEDEEAIVKAIKELETYSDIVDLDYELRNNGGLEGFINKTITLWIRHDFFWANN